MFPSFLKLFILIIAPFCESKWRHSHHKQKYTPWSALQGKRFIFENYISTFSIFIS